MADEEVGQRTYEAYGTFLLEHNWQGIWLPWDKLTPLMYAAWNHAARVAQSVQEGGR